MKFTWKIAIALAIVLCLAATLISCFDGKETYIYITDETGEIVTDEVGVPVTEPDLDGDGVGDGTTAPDGSSEISSDVAFEEINAESGWSELFPVNKQP